MTGKTKLVPPDHYHLGEDLNWEGPWIEVNLWVELPFWLMVDGTRLEVEIEGHGFWIALHDNYFELYGATVTYLRATVIYQGPPKKLAELSDEIREVLRTKPGLWRKCKTVLKIETRCNEQLWNAAMGRVKLRDATIKFYLADLCRAHIPVVNKLIQGNLRPTADRKNPTLGQRQLTS